MPITRYIVSTAALWLFCCQLAFGQKGVTLDIEKPKEFENRILRSEKSDQKKFSGTKRFIQNNFTHYNYFFNANNKLNEVLERARLVFRDDYSELIPFYNYSLDVTAADSIQLDSISYKAQTAIVLHDLRNDWADNMYLLWGASYFLQKKFDSASLMFQFINYAFAAKEKDGYYLTIGSARDGNKPTEISTKEKKNSFMRRAFSEPPSRNDAFIWQIRNLLEQEKYAHAASLIQALRNDPLFPSRLEDDLEEMQAYFFYKQNQWDSSAAHLEKALTNASTKQEKARWEYLLGQLYEASGQFTQAENWYSKSIGHTTDPIMDIYARLASIRVNKDGGEKAIDKNIAELLRMAKRDKYFDYRDIIYYMAAQMELERNNIDGALALLKRSISYPSTDPVHRNRTFLQAAELSFQRGLYRQSYNFYDSLKMEDTVLRARKDIPERKAILARLADNQEIITRQDSLQALAAMPEDERRDFVKKIARQLRKQQGLKEESTGFTTGIGSIAAQPTSLFNEPDKKGEWYFYNNNARQKGVNEFKSRWGNRPNVDNWRRSSALTGASNRPTTGVPGQQATTVPGKDILATETREITFNSLYDQIPLTPEKTAESNDSIQTAMYALGYIYIQELEDCTHGTDIFEKLRDRFPTHPRMEEVLFNLYFCYNKQGEASKATAAKQELAKQFPSSNYNAIITTGKNPNQDGPDTEATKSYEAIYDLFIEGKFDEAVEKKKEADQRYGRGFWTPQLLYIESVYYIRQRQDSAAKSILKDLMNQFAFSPIAAKASTLLDVLSRREMIEEELRNYVIAPKDSTPTRPPVDLTTAPPPARETATLVTPKKDTVATIPVAPPVVVAPPPARDSAIAKPAPLTYSFEAEAPHYVVLILNKVDLVFMNEAKNAFNRYNRDTYYNKQMTSELVEFDSDNRFLLISPFKNAAEALAYIDQARPRTSSEIIPWLKGGKYTYSVITEKNLEVLRGTKDLDKYTEFLQKSIPGKF